MKHFIDIYRTHPWLPLLIITANLLALNIFFSTEVDMIWRVFESRAILEGARLYTDIVNIQTPIYIFLFVPLVLIADFFSIDPLLFTKITILLLANISCLFCTVIIINDSSLSKNMQTALILAVWLLIVSATAEDIGEKSHMLVMLTMPYILMASQRLNGRNFSTKTSVIVGILAGIGFLTKLIYLPIPLTIEVYLYIKSRKKNLDSILIAMLITVIVLLLGTFIFFPEYFPLFLFAKNVYPSYAGTLGMPPSLLLLGIFYVISAALLFLQQPKFSLNELQIALALAATITFLLGLVQQNASLHHFYATTVFLLTCLVVNVRVSQAKILPLNLRKDPSHLVNGLPILLILFFVVLQSLVALNFKYLFLQNPTFAQKVTALRSFAHNDTVHIFSNTGGPALYYAYFADTIPTSRFFSLWMYPYIYQYETTLTGDPIKAKHAKDYMLSSTLSDLQQHQPTYLLVDKRFYKNSTDTRYDLLDYFKKEPALAEQLKAYELIDSSWDDYNIYAKSK